MPEKHKRGKYTLPVFIGSILSGLFQNFEKVMYWIRDMFWNYPDRVFLSPDSLSKKIAKLYQLTRPYSHLVLAAILCLSFGLYAAYSYQVKALVNDSSKLIEGIVTGVDSEGNIQLLTKVNPLLPSSIQLEKDISELIYEPLIVYQQDTTITPVLAKSIVRIQEGADYEFVLRDDVLWHDGKKFGVEDVIKSLEIVSQLDKDNSFIQAVKQMAWETTGENSVRICTKATNAPENTPCSGVSGTKPILANFLELISFKIMPAHLIGDLNALTIDKPDPLINRFPVGTGKYKFAGSDSKRINLTRNDDYYGSLPSITSIEFKLFADEAKAVAALETGEIHSLITASTEYSREVDQYPQITLYHSPTLENQYWALYFNLKKNPNGDPLGPSSFQDVNVRRGISSAINRARLIEALQGNAEEAISPIAESSEFFNADAGWYRYSKDRANTLLDTAGWNTWVDTPIDEEGDGTSANTAKIRSKDGELLEFDLAYTDSFDRTQVVNSIVQDLLEVGVLVHTKSYSLSDLNEQVALPKLFDMLLYGMNTFIDPDRYELFHSDQELNLSSYVGTEESVKIEGNQTVRVPKIDKLLEQGRRFDPDDAKEKRKETYDSVQQIIASDTPLVMLYHPMFLYYLNDRVNNVDLANVNSLERRFSGIESWTISSK
jgi:peptide/nickel transport system substrate-binding protein